MKNPVCLNYHILKNAGKTIDWILEKNFGKDALKFDDIMKPRCTLSTEQMLQFLANHHNAKSISSHQLRFPVPRHPDFQFLAMAFFRHPIDRAYSIYSFMKRDTRDDHYILKAKSSTLKQFIQFNLESDYKVMRNFQVRFLSRQDNMADIDIHDLYRAYGSLKQCTVFGIVERMDESLVLGEELLRNYFPELDMSYITQNISHDRNGTLNERLEKGRLEIGSELMDRLIESNNLDFLLYDYASKKLDELMNNINNFNNKLSDFKKRCQELMLLNTDQFAN